MTIALPHFVSKLHGPVRILGGGGGGGDNATGQPPFGFTPPAPGDCASCFSCQEVALALVSGVTQQSRQELTLLRSPGNHTRQSAQSQGAGGLHCTMSPCRPRVTAPRRPVRPMLSPRPHHVLPESPLGGEFSGAVPEQQQMLPTRSDLHMPAVRLGPDPQLTNAPDNQVRL